MGRGTTRTTGALKSKPAILQEAGSEFEDFFDVRAGAGDADAGRVYALSGSGTLCAFDADSRVLEGWVSLRARGGRALDVTPHAIIAAGADGLVRIFEPGTLAFRGTLPKPPPMGAPQGDAYIVEGGGGVTVPG